jgi:hypothetical protein
VSARIHAWRLGPLCVATMLTTLGGITHAEGGQPLRVCLPEDSAPYSWVERNRGAGLDHDLLAAVAARLGREFEPLWFESRYDKEGKGGMPAWKDSLNDEQIQQLWAYVQTGGAKP